METWLRERVLQRYVIENKSKFKPFGMKILNIRDNKDKYPDLYCTLENGIEIPPSTKDQQQNRIGISVNVIMIHSLCTNT